MTKTVKWKKPKLYTQGGIHKSSQVESIKHVAEIQLQQHHLGYVLGLRKPGFGFSWTIKQLRPCSLGFLLYSPDAAC